jgi:uncharacterized membrane protein
MSVILAIIHAIENIHPIHPLFVHFPIALVSAALFFILLALWRRDDILEKIAFADLSLGWVSTIVAGITGIRDNLSNYNGNAPNHITKIILASTLFVILTATIIARWRDKDLFHKRGAKAIYVTAYCVSFVIVSLLGYFGGVIVYGG